MPETKNKILHFLQYHNLTLVILMFIIGFGTASLASDNVRDAIFEKEVKEVGVDNTMLLTADIDNFDFQPQINDIEEDGNYYYVDYQYRTLGVKDNVWQEVIQEKELKVPKEVLAQSNKDLPSYITEEIGEVIMREYQLLKDSQKIAREQGLTKKQKVIAYKGLIGKILNLQPKVIVENQEKLAAQISETEIAQNNNTQQLAENSQQETENVNKGGASRQPSSLEDFVDRDLIKQIVEEILAQREQETQEVLAVNNQGLVNTQPSQTIEQFSNEQTTIEQPSTDEQVSEQASEQTSEEQIQQDQQNQEDQQEISEEGGEDVEVTEEDINQEENLTESQEEDRQEEIQEESQQEDQQEQVPQEESQEENQEENDQEQVQEQQTEEGNQQQDQEQNQTQNQEEESQTRDQQQKETNGGEQTQQQNQGGQETQPSNDQSQSGDQDAGDSQAAPDNSQQTQG